MSEIYIALLRGINVGGKNLLPMKDLSAIFAEAGCGDVRTYIQSGNVIFSAEPEQAPTLPNLISARITAQFGFQAPVVLRTAAQLTDVLKHNLFLALGAAEESLHVLFLADQPAAERVGALDPDRSPPDAFTVRGREIYLCLPNGAGRTKLTNAYFEMKLATVSTGRNWRTVKALRSLMG